MPKGGAREGAGRKPGSPNKKTAELQAKVASEGITPLEYMLSVLRDEANPADVRLDAANKAAPYVHAKLAAVEHTGTIQTDNTHRVEEPIRPFAEFLGGALGPGAASVPGGVGQD